MTRFRVLSLSYVEDGFTMAVGRDGQPHKLVFYYPSFAVSRHVEAPTAEDAVAIAKRTGYFAPIVEEECGQPVAPPREPLVPRPLRRRREISRELEGALA